MVTHYWKTLQRFLGEYWIYHKSTLEDTEDDVEKNPESKLWNVVKHSKVSEGGLYSLATAGRRQNPNDPNGYTLMPNDVIKLGRVRFKVREIVSPVYTKKQQRDNQKHKQFIENPREFRSKKVSGLDLHIQDDMERGQKLNFS